MKYSDDELVEQLLANRNISNKELFLNPPYFDVNERDPFLFKDMDKAVERLKTAKQNNQKVVVYGDYDIDGLTATALLIDVFESIGLNVHHYTPDRFEEGYGLNSEALTYIKGSLEADVVVTVDCGTVSFAELKHASSIGLDVIVTDHHQPQSELPPAVAIINPHRSDNEYPFDDFAGVGVAFKFAQALQTQFEGLAEGHEKWLLDLVALGTVCDVVPLVDENRSLVKWGLEVLSQTKRPGLRALMESARVDASNVDAQDLGYRLGPRLNASGRLTHAKRSLKLLTTKSKHEAESIAAELEQLNSERRRIQKEVLDDAISIATQQHEQSVLVVAGEDWNEGVIGIVAARLVELFDKPSFVFSISGDLAKASARSFGGFSAVEAIEAAKAITLSGGGHRAAGGCTVRKDDINRFKKIINDHYDSLGLETDQERELRRPQPDISIESTKPLTPQLVSSLSILEPFGQGNPEPLFEIKVSKYQQKLVGSNKNHLKLELSDKDGDTIGAILFGQEELLDELSSVVATISSSDYSQRGVELIIRDYA